MTSQIKNYIDLEDLLGIRLECLNCGTCIDLPMKRAGTGTPIHCPSCKTEWINQYEQPNAGIRISGLVEQVKMLKSFMESTKGQSKFLIALEITGTNVKD